MHVKIVKIAKKPKNDGYWQVEFAAVCTLLSGLEKQAGCILLIETKQEVLIAYVCLACRGFMHVKMIKIP